MTSSQWEALSAWHNAWLAADPQEQARLRQQLARDAPDLVAAADRLTADTRTLEGFLETPALVLEAGALAARYSARPAALRLVDRRRAAWAAAAIAFGLLAGVFGWHLKSVPQLPRPEGPLVRFALALPEGLVLMSAPVVSPDGQRIAFVVGTDASSRLMIRDLGDEGALVVGGTDGAAYPFWSPDGRWIGFSARGRLMRVASDGGAPVVIDGAVGAWGGAWSPSHVVVFQPAVRNAGLLQVPDSGGRPEPASILDDSAGDVVHRDPVVLPDGGRFLYCLDSTDAARRGMYLARLDTTNAAERIGWCPATYVPVTGSSGLLLFATGSHIEVRPFDSSRLSVGDPRVIDVAPARDPQESRPLFTATADVLAYALSPRTAEASQHIGIVIGWRRLMRQPQAGSPSD